MDNDNLLEEYYTQNARKLRRMVDRILRRFSGISQKDYDDFYSLANEVFTGALRRFDGTQSFEGFLYACLFNRIKTEFTKRNREKRKTDTQCVSLDTPVGDGESVLGDMLESDFNMEAELEKKEPDLQNTWIGQFLEELSGVQKKIVRMKLDGLTKADIMEQLHINEHTYSSNMKKIKNFDRSRVLHRHKEPELANVREGKLMNKVISQTAEKSKPKNYQVYAIIQRMYDYSIRLDHPLQRESEQWSNVMKGNLISDILQDNPIPPLVFAEQVIDGVVIIWAIDGKQRCSNVESFRRNGFRISKNVERYQIKYQTAARDQEGNIIFDDNGLPR